MFEQFIEKFAAYGDAIAVVVVTAFFAAGYSIALAELATGSPIVFFA